MFPLGENGVTGNNDNADDSPFIEGRGFSLESIMAEMKSTSVIDSVIAPSHILEAEAERILREAALAAGSAIPGPPAGDEQDFFGAHRPEPEDFPQPEPEIIPEPEIAPQPAQPVIAKQPVQPIQPEQPVQPVQPEPEPFFDYDPAPPAGALPPDIFDDEPVRITFPKYEDDPAAAADRLITEVYDRFGKPGALRTGSRSFNMNDEPEFNDSVDIPVIITPSEDENPAQGSGGFTDPDIPGAFFDAQQQPVDSGFDDTRRFDGTPGQLHTVPERSRHKKHTPANETLIIDEKLQEDDYEQEEIYEEPRLKDQAVRFARTCNSISVRLLPAFLISVIMALMTFVFEAGLAVPFGIGQSLVHSACVLVILLLVVMMLCVEVLVRGMDFMIRGEPNAETLILFSCVFSLLSAVFTIMSGKAQMLPFCAVSALSLVFAAYGERSGLRAMTDSLKTAISSPEPYGVQAEFNSNLNNTVIKKAYGRTDGFYSSLTEQDITEVLYRFAAPALLTLALAVTVLGSLVSGSTDNSLHMLSALLAAAAPFSALLTYTLPFGIVTKALRSAGVALAGWGGADEIAHTNGVCITDDDLFPQGTLKLTSIKVFDGAPKNNVLCYTASLIMASGSGLAGLFAQVLKEQGITPLRVVDFECHESGISAIIQGHQIATGSAAHMNLIGVRVPDDSNLRNAVFTAVNKRLVAMFAIDYKPLPAVQGALISLLRWRIDLYFAMRDFNITPSMVGQKFKVPFENFVFMSVQDSYSISDPYSGKQGRMSSVLVRESLGPYAEAITAARLLRSASIFATAISVASAVLGIFLMTVMLWGGAYMSATPGNLIMFMLCMLGAVLLICAYVKIRR